jgi:competence protein CoiA
VLDATELLTRGAFSAPVLWEQLYRVRPRPVLTCTACSHGVHAKKSPLGLRYFAHDAGAPECVLLGESMAHRLLKLELVTAVRDAGWQARLEVSGDGWRADVLAISPDGTDRMAWEAQLARATREELEERTARLGASGVRVCWITDAVRPFAGHVPTIRLGRPVSELEHTEPLEVVDGLAAFDSEWCSAEACSKAGFSMWIAQARLPCPGHGSWVAPPGRISLGTFVAAALVGTVAPYAPRLPGPQASHPQAGPLIWTTRRHRDAESAQVTAAARAQKVRASHERDALARLQGRAAHREYVASIDDMLILAIQRRHSRGGVHDAFVDEPQQFWGMGRPVIVNRRVTHVLSPAPSHVTGAVRSRLAKVVIVVASHESRAALTERCLRSQQFLVLDATGRCMSQT